MTEENTNQIENKELKSENKVEVIAEVKEQASTGIPSKFKSVEELSKAYIELEKKLSSGNVKTEKLTEVKQEAPAQATTVTPESFGIPKEKEGVFKSFVDIYGDKLAGFIADVAKNGQPTEEGLRVAESAGLTKKAISRILELEKIAEERQIETKKKSQDKLLNIAGGKDDFMSMVNWAKESLDQERFESFAKTVDFGSESEAELAIEGMVQKWTKAVSRPPKTVLSGTKNLNDSIGYKTMEDAVEDMAKKEYLIDPVFQQKVISKFKLSKF